jgi:7-cyano-7-deazaguanine synthase
MNATAGTSNHSNVGLLLSGGLDSGILLGQFLRGGRRVQPFHVRCGLAWEEAELDAVHALLEAMRAGLGERRAALDLQPLFQLKMPLCDLYGDHWSLTGRNTPDADTPDEAVYLPGRNALLAIKPALWCAMHGIEELALGVLASNPFSDATEAFFGDFQAAMEKATGRRVRLTRPFAGMNKMEVMALGRGLPLELTFSCIAPVGRLHCGRCNKCAERKRAFRDAGADDLTEYHQDNRSSRIQL